MRLEDIQLRDAARRGELRACLEMAGRLFSGKRGFAQNVKLGLAYLQEHIWKKVPAAIFLVGDSVPLEMLMLQRCRDTLAEAARLGSDSARFKLGIWLMLRKAERTEGVRWVELSRRCGADWRSENLDNPKEFARVLNAATSFDAQDTREVAILGAREALKEGDVADACFCIAASAELGISRDRLGDVVSLIIQLAATNGARLPLTVDLVESCLRGRSEQGDWEAQFVLGCALAGLPYGLLDPTRLARRTDFRKAGALFLRAAHAGKCEAWLYLADMASNRRNPMSNPDAARFYLEKAAKSGVVVAQRRLGAFLLKEATCVEKAEAGVNWLCKAASQSDSLAEEMLRTLVLPLPELSGEYENSTIEKVRTIDPELGLRLSLARVFHLTRRETINLNPKCDIRDWGLLIPGTSKENPKGRLAPAINDRMRLELQLARTFFHAANSVGNSLVLQRSRAQRQVFKALSISESQFFAQEIGRSWSHYGFGRHWAARAAPLLTT